MDYTQGEKISFFPELFSNNGLPSLLCPQYIQNKDVKQYSITIGIFRYDHVGK